MKKYLFLLVIFFGFLFCTVRLPAQTTGGTPQVSPVANLSGSNSSVVNNNFQQLQNGMNGILYSIEQYFPGGIVQTKNGGTGVNLSTSTTGDTLVMTSSGTVGVVANGTSGYYLQSQGYASPPIWSNIVTSNVLFQWNGVVDAQDDYVGTHLTAASNVGGYHYIHNTANNSNYETVLSTKFQKISGMNTVTVYVRGWGGSGCGVSITIGALSPVIVSNIGGNTAPGTWSSGTLNVSSLTNGTVYDVLIGLADSGSSAANNFLANVISFGS